MNEDDELYEEQSSQSRRKANVQRIFEERLANYLVGLGVPESTFSGDLSQYWKKIYPNKLKFKCGTDPRARTMFLPRTPRLDKWNEYRVFAIAAIDTWIANREHTFREKYNLLREERESHQQLMNTLNDISYQRASSDPRTPSVQQLQDLQDVYLMRHNNTLNANTYVSDPSPPPSVSGLHNISQFLQETSRNRERNNRHQPYPHRSPVLTPTRDRTPPISRSSETHGISIQRTSLWSYTAPSINTSFRQQATSLIQEQVQATLRLRNNLAQLANNYQVASDRALEESNFYSSQINELDRLLAPLRQDQRSRTPPRQPTFSFTRGGSQTDIGNPTSSQISEVIAINDNASPEHIIEFGPIPTESSLSVHQGELERDMPTVDITQETDYDEEGEECSVCLFGVRKDVHPKLRCPHLFHKYCLTKWWRQQIRGRWSLFTVTDGLSYEQERAVPLSCPTCRHPVSLQRARSIVGLSYSVPVGSTEHEESDEDSQ